MMANNPPMATMASNNEVSVTQMFFFGRSGYAAATPFPASTWMPQSTDGTSASVGVGWFDSCDRDTAFPDKLVEGKTGGPTLGALCSRRGACANDDGVVDPASTGASGLASGVLKLVLHAGQSMRTGIFSSSKRASQTGHSRITDIDLLRFEIEKQWRDVCQHFPIRAWSVVVDAL